VISLLIADKFKSGIVDISQFSIKQCLPNLLSFIALMMEPYIDLSTIFNQLNHCPFIINDIFSNKSLLRFMIEPFVDKFKIPFHLYLAHNPRLFDLIVRYITTLAIIRKGYLLLALFSFLL
jgi:hypothetical protein